MEECTIRSWFFTVPSNPIAPLKTRGLRRPVNYTGAYRRTQSGLCAGVQPQKISAEHTVSFIKA